MNVFHFREMKNLRHFLCVIPCLLVLFVNLSLVTVRKLWTRSSRCNIPRFHASLANASVARWLSYKYGVSWVSLLVLQRLKNHRKCFNLSQAFLETNPIKKRSKKVLVHASRTKRCWCLRLLIHSSREQLKPQMTTSRHPCLHSSAD